MTLPRSVKFSRMTATSRLSSTNEPVTWDERDGRFDANVTRLAPKDAVTETGSPVTWKETKYGTASQLPQSPSSGAQKGGSTRQSPISPDQPSPVMHWSSSSSALPNVEKLRFSSRNY